MSQRDLVAELRAAHVTAPAEVRERVRLIAADSAPPEPRRFTWRRALVVAVPVAAAVAASVVFATRPAHHTATPPLVERSAVHGSGSVFGAPTARAQKSIAVPSPPGRVQTVSTSIAVRVPQISDAVKR